jgi:rubrerythrin
MSDAPQVAVLAEGTLLDMKRLARLLDRGGIEAHLTRAANCSTCSPKMWLVCDPTDAQTASALIGDQWRAKATPEELAAAMCVVDHNAETVTCPACGYTFPSGPEECPDCELRLV